jgi:hypothetical protein
MKHPVATANRSWVQMHPPQLKPRMIGSLSQTNHFHRGLKQCDQLVEIGLRKIK